MSMTKVRILAHALFTPLVSATSREQIRFEGCDKRRANKCSELMMARGNNHGRTKSSDPAVPRSSYLGVRLDSADKINRRCASKMRL